MRTAKRRTSRYPRKRRYSYKVLNNFESMANISSANKYDAEFKFSMRVDDPDGKNFATPLRSSFICWSIEVDDPSIVELTDLKR